MKMIDVLNMITKNEIKEGTKLKIGYKIYNYVKDYTDSENCSFISQEDNRTKLLEDNELITTDFLKSDVELIPPKTKKYYLKVNKHVLDCLNYVNRLNEGFGVISYTISYNKEANGYQAKFTQHEIDEDKFLKFIEEHGIKKEVEENEVD